ncbi:TolC family protein [Adhaeretor mobilis]|uniref:Outer membrane channel protein n=1 Tax=Adhaeretor mobilis TaxID=1930276 RepID=A0A517MYE4_9BACT|nr:TolC family protein [Adhaeretor mobilis]QDS99912.1 outer membrane channel protein [Adhaeretor mobilis]
MRRSVVSIAQSGRFRTRKSRLFLSVLLCLICSSIGQAENDDSILPFIKQEQRRVRYRDPACLPDVYVPLTPPPPTVSSPLPSDADRLLSLDEAIRLALADSEVVRTLAGSIAVSSGRTIYDPAITNNSVDQQRAAFDPQLDVRNTWAQNEPPVAIIDPGDPNRAVFGGIKTENHNVAIDLSQRNLSGGTSSVRFGNDASTFSPGIFALSPQNRYATELSYTQPLLSGSGVLANRVPIVLSRIDTERSFFQFRDSVQELVRGTIEAYWAVVFARTDVWARTIQVEQAEALLKYSEARKKTGFANVTEVAQSQSALAQFRASLISSRANLLTREAALQNMLGIPPSAVDRFVPSTPPTNDRIEFDWNEITQIAQQRRPDLIELKLVIEADQQRLLLAQNQTQPNLDLVALYRWNGLEGEMPNGGRLGTGGNEATDWALGVNFSVPLFLRQERATLRSAQLIVTRDRANLEQGVHNARHLLALNFRNLETFYQQYEAFQEAREAAYIFLKRQLAARELQQPVLLFNVLQALGDWGNSVSQEAQALAQYNTELANLERQSGTILETHGVFFWEDRYCSLGPLWAARQGKLYPRDIRPSKNEPQYPIGDEPAEEFFDLDYSLKRLPPTTDEPAKRSPPPLPLPPAETPQKTPELLPKSSGSATAVLAFPESVARQ